MRYIFVFLLMVMSSYAQAQEMPAIPESASYYFGGGCYHQITGEPGWCDLYRDDDKVYTLFRWYKDGPVERLLYSEGLNQPVTIWFSSI
jgi:hypothetical protein